MSVVDVYDALTSERPYKKQAGGRCGATHLTALGRRRWESQGLKVSPGYVRLSSKERGKEKKREKREKTEYFKNKQSTSHCPQALTDGFISKGRPSTYPSVAPKGLPLRAASSMAQQAWDPSSIPRSQDRSRGRTHLEGCPQPPHRTVASPDSTPAFPKPHIKINSKHRTEKAEPQQSMTFSSVTQ